VVELVDTPDSKSCELYARAGSSPARGTTKEILKTSLQGSLFCYTALMNIFMLWENDAYTISTPKNPHISYNEGPHIIVAPKHKVANAWQDINIAESTFKLAAEVCKIMEDLQLAPWFNIQANGNWGLLPNAQPFFHVHIYGRNNTDTWGRPITLPEAPKTYKNEPMPEADRTKLIHAFESSLIT
jgi:diadenosine tetraphosphate (Ap4A) HIT family hydrolase